MECGLLATTPWRWQGFSRWPWRESSLAAVGSEGEDKGGVQNVEGGLASTLEGTGALHRTGTRVNHGGGAVTAWRTRWHFGEHLACSGVAGVGDDFGPFPGRIWTWAEK